MFENNNMLPSLSIRTLPPFWMWWRDLTEVYVPIRL